MTIFCYCVIICAPILKKLKHTPQQNLQSYAIRTATETNINYVKVNMLLNCLGERSAGNIIVINKKSAPENTRSASAYRQTDCRYFASSSASASLADFCSGVATFSNEPPAFSSAAITLFDAAAAYPQQNGVFTAYQDGNVVLQRFTVKKPFDCRAAEEQIAHHFHEVRITNEMLEPLVCAFKTHPAYTAVPMYFYEKTLTRTTRDELAQSITPQAFHDIAKFARISIQPVPPTK